MSDEHSFTKEQLEVQAEYHKTALTKSILETELEQSIAKLKMTDIALQSKREDMRPHRLYQAVIAYDPSEQHYVCRLPAYDAEDNEEDIHAYGDTPAAACDNFDHQWVHGHSK